MKLARNYTAMIIRHRMLTRLRLSHNISFVFFPLVKTVYMSNTTDVLQEAGTVNPSRAPYVGSFSGLPLQYSLTFIYNNWS